MLEFMGRDGTLYLDLGDEKWGAVEIDATGWRVIDKPPVRFRRASGMQPLPTPIRGGSVEKLRSFLNVQSQADYVLVVAWALAVVAVCCTPLLVLALHRGSGQLFWVPRPSFTPEKQVLEALTSSGLQPNFRPTSTTLSRTSP